jgi:endonuclease/exonuclease/phosphatase family metal-dependent hydrolase
MTHARTFTAAFLALSITGYSGAQTVKCTTWNLQWFPNGSAKEASAEQQDQRIREAADVLRPINPDIVLLQEVRNQAPPPTTGYNLKGYTLLASRPNDGGQTTSYAAYAKN